MNIASGDGIHFAVLLGSDNSYTTPFEIPFSIRSPLWWRYMVGGPLFFALFGTFRILSEFSRLWGDFADMSFSKHAQGTFTKGSQRHKDLS